MVSNFDESTTHTTIVLYVKIELKGMIVLYCFDREKQEREQEVSGRGGTKHTHCV